MKNNELKQIKIRLNGEPVGTFNQEAYGLILEGIADKIALRLTGEIDEFYRIKDILNFAQMALKYVSCDIEADILTGAFKAVKVELSDKRCKFNSKAYQCALRFIAFELSNIIGGEVTLVCCHSDDIKDFASAELWLSEEKPAQKEEPAQA